jgi:hypothetical protein
MAWPLSDYSLPFIIENRNLTTIQLTNSDKTKRKFINISSKLFGISNVLTVTEAKINNSRLKIDNYSSSISVKVYQQGFINNEIYLSPGSQAIFAWPSIKERKILRFNFGFGDLDTCCIMVNHKTKYEILNENLEVIKGKKNQESKMYPYEEIIPIYNNYYHGQKIKLAFSTDGEKFIVKIHDEVNTSQKISHKKTEFEFQAEIPKFGLSLIGDNTYSTCHAKNFSGDNRAELCYILIENIQLFYGTATSDKKCIKKMQ